MKYAVVLDRGVRLKLNRAAVDRAFERAYRNKGARALASVAHTFGLSKTELGRLFRVTRQAIDDWFARGVPPARIADVERIASLAATLERRFKPERLPQIVRSPLPGLQGRTILAAIAERGAVSVLDMLDRAFAYSVA
ncbi:hypothetical protein EPN52_00815 [bacterium]|nr:MAG: hypothetical protein EPN52_00815 [bacterium]